MNSRHGESGGPRRAVAILIGSAAAMGVLWVALDPAAGAPHEGVELLPLLPMMLALALVLVVFLGDPELVTSGVAATLALLGAIPYYPGNGLWTLSLVGAAVFTPALYLSARLGMLARGYFAQILRARRR